MSESVYNLVNQEPYQTQKKPLFRSSFTKALEESLKQAKEVSKKPHASFGPPPGTSAKNPKQPLKKLEKTFRMDSLKELKENEPEKLMVKEHLKSKVKPPLIKPTERPALLRSKEPANYLVANAVEVILAPAKKKNTGLPDYMQKDDYGKVPSYLEKIKSDIKSEYAYIDQLRRAAEEQEKSKVTLLPEEERQKLLTALKGKWERVNGEYQNMSHLTKLDSVGKKRRKEQFEKELTNIEKDIERLSRGEFVYIDQTK
jgi:Calmodulin-binding